MKWDETSDHELGWFESQHYNVLCPVGFFFGTPLKAQNMKSLPLKVEIIDKGQLSLNSYFPMPFWHNAHISLHNRSQYPVYINGAEVSVSKIMYPETQTGYFCTAYREGMTAYDCDWLFLETPGTGWFIGAVQTGQN